jgi:pilus assembly protein Flp/PilA
MESHLSPLLLPMGTWKGTRLSKLHRFIWDLLVRDDGPTAVEYAVLLALIIVGCLVAILAIGNNLDEVYELVTAAFN